MSPVAIAVLAVGTVCFAITLTRMYKMVGLPKTVLGFFIWPYAFWWAMQAAGDVIDPDKPRQLISNKLLAGVWWVTWFVALFV